MKNFKLVTGDSFELIKKIPDNFIDSIVTDPPYGLKFMGKDWDKPDNIAFEPDFWKEVLRVLKPGGHLLAFSGSRTYHWMATAVEKAGFEIRDQVMYLYGSGFPKSLNISKNIDKTLGVESIQGKIKSNWLNKDGSVVNRNLANHDSGNGHKYGFNDAPRETHPNSQEAKQWEGWGTALKPAHEPLVLARKPITEKTIAKNVLKFGTGGINIDESRISTDGDKEYEFNMKANERSLAKEGEKLGLHDGGWKVDKTPKKLPEGRHPSNVILEDKQEIKDMFPKGNSKFFYGSKCSPKDRNEGLESIKNIHTTVKPTDLMRYLVKLITPNNGIILDPFSGSGSTGKAIALLNKNNSKNYKYIGIDLNKEYTEIAKERIKFTINNKTWLERREK